jgi:hypothetical protein
MMVIGGLLKCYEYVMKVEGRLKKGQVIVKEYGIGSHGFLSHVLLYLPRTGGDSRAPSGAKIKSSQCVDPSVTVLVMILA